MPNVIMVFYVFLVDADETFRNQASQFMSEHFLGMNLHVAMSVKALLDPIKETPPYFMIANIESMDVYEATQLVAELGERRRRLIVTWFDDRRKADAEQLARIAGGIAVKKGWFSTVAMAIKNHLAALEVAELEEAARLAEGE